MGDLRGLNILSDRSPNLLIAAIAQSFADSFCWEIDLESPKSNG
jgi:uncharacterized protein (DUF2249 family)